MISAYLYSHLNRRYIEMPLLKPSEIPANGLSSNTIEIAVFTKESSSRRKYKIKQWPPLLYFIIYLVAYLVLIDHGYLKSKHFYGICIVLNPQFTNLIKEVCTLNWLSRGSRRKISEWTFILVPVWWRTHLIRSDCVSSGDGSNQDWSWSIWLTNRDIILWILPVGLFDVGFPFVPTNYNDNQVKPTGYLPV